MKTWIRTTSALLVASLLMQSCASMGGALNDDAFAHAVKSGNHAETMHRMMPHHGKLQIQEKNGRWYNPLQYTIASGDQEASFALLERGAPTSFDGKSLAYNAARTNHPDLANAFANAGYGSRSDINQATAELRAAQRANQRANEAAFVLGTVFLLEAMKEATRPRYYVVY